VLGRVVVEGEQHVEVVGDLRGCLGPLRPVAGDERACGLLGVLAVFGVPDLGECGLRAGLTDLGSALSTLAILRNQHRCSRVSGNTSRSAAQKSQSAVADREHRGAHPSALARTEQAGPRLGGFTVPVVKGDQFLGAVGAHAHHDQQAHLVLLQPDLEVDPIDPVTLQNAAATPDLRIHETAPAAKHLSAAHWRIKRHDDQLVMIRWPLLPGLVGRCPL
jgi:hypothetical protein